MRFRRIFLEFTPNLIILAATDLRCLLRSTLISSRIGYQNTNVKPALIVAPHPDDETFSCAGLIRLKRAAGVPVRILVLTDGEAVGVGRCERPETVRTDRQRELLDACQRLGVKADSVRWLHLPDGKLPRSGQPGFDEAAQALLTEIKAFAPGEVYCPHWHDGHSDHIASNQLTHQALLLWSHPCGLLYYPVWMWYHASSGLRKRLDTSGAWPLDITTVLADKQRAMAAYLDAPKTSEAIHSAVAYRGLFYRFFGAVMKRIFPALADDGNLAVQVIKHAPND